MLFLRGIDVDSLPVSQKEIKDTKGNHSKSYIKMQFSFQLEVHIGADIFLCALRLLTFPKLALRVLLTKVIYSPPEGGGSSGVQPLHSCTTSITNQLDFRQGFQP